MTDLAQPTLIDRAGAPVKLPEEEIPAAVASGKVAFLKGQQIPVLDPHGNTGTIPAEDAFHAFAQGYKYEPIASQAERAKAEEFGSTGNQIRAGLAGAARGATLGLSDVAMTKSGLVEPETLENLKKYNPVTSSASEIGGAIAPIVASGGLGAGVEAAEAGAGTLANAARLAPSSLVAKAGTAVTEGLGKAIGSEGAKSLAARVAGKALPTFAGSAVEGALFTGGAELSDHVLGDPNQTAKSVAADIGLGALIGGGLGVGLSAGGSALKRILGRSSGIAPEATGTAVARDAIAADAGTLGEMGPGGVITPPPAGEFPADAMADIRARNASGKNYQNAPYELGQKQALLDAEAILPGRQYPLQRVQADAFDNAGTRDKLGIFKESQGPEADAYREYEGRQKSELAAITRHEMRSLAPEATPATSEVEGGNRALGAIEDQYLAEKKELKPLWDRFDKTAINTVKAPAEIVEKINEAIPGAAKHIRIDNADGTAILEKFSTKMPFSKNVHGAIADLLDAANSDDLTIAQFRNAREALRDRLNLLTPARDTSLIGALRKSSMDFMGDQIHEMDPSLGVRDLFKRNAINEQNRQELEKILGGRIGKKGVLAREIVPEKVLDKIFTNSVTVHAAKEILGEVKFNAITRDYLETAFTDAIDKTKGGFSSNKFYSFLRGKAPQLEEALSGSPDTLKKINAALTQMRILPDAASINPSGTAKTTIGLLQRIKHIGEFLKEPEKIPGKMISGGAEKLSDFMERRQEKKEIYELLNGDKAARVHGLKNIENIQHAIGRGIESAAKAFLNTAADKAAVVPPSVHYLMSNRLDHHGREKGSEEKYAMYDKRIQEITKAVSDPKALADNIGANLAPLSKIAPNVAQGLSQHAVEASRFLFEKAPKDPDVGNSILPHLTKYRPSDSQIAEWERYVTAVDHPMSVLSDLKHGQLTVEGVEALKTIYPDIYSKAVGHLTDGLSSLKTDLPYQKKLQLATFLGTSVDTTTSPSFTMAMQATHGQAQAQEAGAKQGMSLPGVSKMRFVDQTKTDTQKTLTSKG